MKISVKLNIKIKYDAYAERYVLFHYLLKNCFFSSHPWEGKGEIIYCPSCVLAGW